MLTTNFSLLAHSLFLLVLSKHSRLFRRHNQFIDLMKMVCTVAAAVSNLSISNAERKRRKVRELIEKKKLKKELNRVNFSSHENKFSSCRFLFLLFSHLFLFVTLIILVLPFWSVLLPFLQLSLALTPSSLFSSHARRANITCSN